ncbi:MAG: DNA alkylation response protein, partial [Psychrosphaera sp.]|nr:DNA alkylation response protein [Psychrosphaera sp.]
VSNASAETELRGALGWMVGDEGRGIAVILDMVAMTRFDCMIGSAAGMRQAVAQATHHCCARTAFGKLLAEQPLMQNVLADLVLENEAALAYSMRIARALDNSQSSEQEQLLVRLGTAVGKYWICKRAPGHAYEAMECIGGSGVMEDTIMPRLFRESPINSIWEGSGNVQCLDMMRVIGKKPATLDVFMAEVAQAKGANAHLDSAINGLGNCFKDQKTMEYRARSIVQQMALAIQASTLVQYGDAQVAEAFCASRVSGDNDGWVYGTLPVGIDCAGLIKRALPLCY